MFYFDRFKMKIYGQTILCFDNGHYLIERLNYNINFSNLDSPTTIHQK